MGFEFHDIHRRTLGPQPHRSRPKRRKPDSMTTVDPLVERLYSRDALLELRRNVLRYARSFPPGYERNQRRQSPRAVQR